AWLKWVVDGKPDWVGLRAFMGTQPEYLSTRNRLVSSKTRLCASSVGQRPICCSFGRTITCAMGSTVCVPHDCTLMNGYRYSSPTVGMPRTSSVSPVLI